MNTAIDSRALLQIVLTTIFLAYASLHIGSFIRGAMAGDLISRNCLIFFAVVALAGGFWGAHRAGVAWAARQEQMRQYRLTHPQ